MGRGGVADSQSNSIVERIRVKPEPNKLRATQLLRGEKLTELPLDALTCLIKFGAGIFSTSCQQPLAEGRGLPLGIGSTQRFASADEYSCKFSAVVDQIRGYPLRGSGIIGTTGGRTAGDESGTDRHADGFRPREGLSGFGVDSCSEKTKLSGESPAFFSIVGARQEEASRGRDPNGSTFVTPVNRTAFVQVVACIVHPCPCLLSLLDPSVDCRPLADARCEGRPMLRCGATSNAPPVAASCSYGVTPLVRQPVLNAAPLLGLRIEHLGGRCWKR